MAFIETIETAGTNEELRAMYERQQGHWGFLPNYAKVFCHRPQIMGLWAQLQAGIKRHMDRRRFELITFASANALRNTYCSLAHGKALTEFIPPEDVGAIVAGEVPGSLSEAEVAMMAFSRKVAHDTTTVTSEDVRHLKRLGFSDAEVFDIAAAAAARAFWTKVLDGLGVEADAEFRAMDPRFTRPLCVGRPL